MMLGKVAAAGATAAVILGAGTAALAVSGDSSSTSGSPASPSSSSSPGQGGSAAGHSGRRRSAIAAALAHHALHGQIVTTDGKGNYTTHDGITGSVNAVSATSITVKSSDGFVQTYAVNSSTKVRTKSDPKSSTISQVKAGDTVGVLGTGTTSPVATYVLDKG